MSVAQGLCTNLMEFAWKSHIRMLYPTPGEFTSFLGDVSTWQGVVTGGSVTRPGAGLAASCQVTPAW